MVIVILGLVVATMMGILSQVSRNARVAEDIAKASFLAQSKMEMMVGRTFNAANYTESGDVSFGNVVYNYTILSGNNVCTGMWPQYASGNITNSALYECIRVTAGRKDGSSANVVLSGLKMQE